MALLDNLMQPAAQSQSQGGGGLLGNDLMMALGLGLMSAGKTGKIDFKGILGNMMQQQQTRALNEYRNQQTQLDLAKFLQEQQQQKQRLELDTNKYNLDAEKQQRQIEGANGISQSIGVEPNVANNFQGQGMLGDIYKQKYDEFAKTGEMPGISPEERRLRITPDLLKMGDTNNAISMLPAPPKYGAPQQVLGQGGQPKLIQVDQSGNVKEIENYQPLIKNGMQLTTNPDGTIEFTQGGIANQVNANGQVMGAPAKSTVGDLQKDIIDSKGYINRLDQISKDYSSSYLTYLGKARGAIDSLTGKVFGSSGDKEFLQGKTKFSNGVNQLFNQYRKEITGAAAAIQELDRLMKSMLNENQSPEEFEASYSQFRGLVQKGLETKQQLLREGIPYGSKEFGQRMDAALVGGNSQNSPQANQSQTNSSNNGIRTFNPETGKFE